MIHRRGFLTGLGALLAAPAIIRTPGLLMPVRPALVPRYDMIGDDFTPDSTLLSSQRLSATMLNAFRAGAVQIGDSWTVHVDWGRLARIPY